MASPPRNRGWLVFWVVLTILAILGVTLGRLFSPLPRLTRDGLTHARELWQKNGPPDYTMEYTKRGSATGTFLVTVRKGKVVSVYMKPNDTPTNDAGQLLEERLFPFHDMLALLDDIDTFLTIDAKPGSPPANKWALFDPHDGHLLRYIRKVPNTEQLLEIKVLDWKAVDADRRK